MLATFDSMTAAASTISEIIESKIIPCTLEFLDSTTIRCVEQFAKIGLPLDVASLLLMEVDGHAAEVEEQAAAIVGIARARGAQEVRLARSEEEASQLRRPGARRSVPWPAWLLR